MRRLFQDFLSQGWLMKGVIALGWLCVLVMAASLVDNLRQILAG